MSAMVCYRGGDRIAGRSVDDHDARAGRRLDVDPVDPDARHADDAQARRCGRQELGVDSRLRAHDQGVPSAALAKEAEHRVAAEPGAELGVMRCGEEIDADLGDRLDNEDAGHS